MRQLSGEPGWMSTTLSALVAGPERFGTVVSSSPYACYLLLHEPADPAVIAMVSPDAVRLPISMCVHHVPLLPPATPAIVGGGVISAAGRRWTPVRWWDPSPHLDPRLLRLRGHHLYEVVCAESPSSYGIRPDLARAAVTALMAGDPEPACGILGLGPGLTPSGDDVIAGACAALALTGELPPAADEVVIAAKTRTTSLSAALISAAAQGQVVPQVAHLLGAVAAGKRRSDVAALSRRVFAIGATSGHDLALGLAAALTTPARVEALEAI